MFSVLAVGYLFLGGAGAGAIVVASILDLAWVKAPFGAASRISIGEATPLERVAAFGLLAGFAALALGVLCLLFDLGRIDRVVVLLLRPSPTFLTVGTYALAALAACAAFLAAVRFAYLPGVPRGAVRAVEAVAAVVGVVVMLYTGLLLQSMGAVALWRSPLVPALFVLSSLSCGIAVLLLAAFFAPADAAVARFAHALARIDAAVIALEAVAAALLVALALGGDHPTAAASAQRLTSGDLAAWWWVGFALCGLVVPLVAEVAFAARRASGRTLRTALAVAAVLVLVGGFSMRAALADAGTHRDLELEAPLNDPGAMARWAN
ncbi:polysulfide reductase NrfD [Eggerthella guodeyinii]|uniref:Polysulfide reductase NrfD n=1 Tax=Eggerthella guodeyinii TaxID=2690837 RepID=A0A6L7IYE1_9ACTN|nr:NrfD/PsrC family molybdoenzyme membrane anchor subunit [Eggerthella guodeyinii]QOS69034.1 polysulfide reductase NrfD [Eggerthella guodeyinii]